MIGKGNKLIGKRVKVVRGTTIDPRRKPNEYYNHIMWCAGDVPVGSTGTIIPSEKSSNLSQIEWDHGQKPKDGYEFGIDRFGYGLEEIQ